MGPYPIYLGNKPVTTTKCMPICSPYDGQKIADVCLAGEREVENAISLAKKAFPSLKALPAYKRSEILLQIKQGVEKRAEELARTCLLYTSPSPRD